MAKIKVNTFLERMEKQRRFDIDSSIGKTQSIENVMQTTVNGYRSLHMNQMYRFGLNNIVTGRNSSYVVGQAGGSNRVGP